jgi:hypothetical protein
VNEDQQQAIVIRPRLLPRDFLDVCLGLPIGLLQVSILFGLPALFAFALTRSLGIAFLAFCLAYGFALLFMVRRLTVATDGLRFHRVLGSPKFLSWNRISSISIAPRGELILRGWLWPLFPSREITPSLSALQHYRITWDTGFCYYPPAHTKDFEQHVVTKIRSDRR